MSPLKWGQISFNILCLLGIIWLAMQISSSILMFIFIIVSLILSVVLSIFLFIVITNHIDSYFIKPDVLILSKEALLFSKHREISFEEIKVYRAQCECRTSTRGRSYVSRSYMLYIETQSEYCYITLLKKQSEEDNKQFAEHVCHVIEQWQNAQAQA